GEDNSSPPSAEVDTSHSTATRHTESILVQIVPRRSGRVSHLPDRWIGLGKSSGLVPGNLESDPRTYNEALQDKDADSWNVAMNAKMGSMDSNQVWDLVEPPDGVRPIRCKWIYKRKKGSDDKSLRDYVARYTRACVDVPSAEEEIKSGGLTRGLLPGLCINSLAKRSGRTFDEVLGRCAKYMNEEEAKTDFLQSSKSGKTEIWEEKKDKKVNSSGGEERIPTSRKRGRSRGWRPTQYTPLSAPQARILEVMEKKIHDNVVSWPRTRKGGPRKPKSNLYCRFHKDYGHNTDYCRHLKDEIERLIKEGHLKEVIYKDRESSSRK
ncbi:cysteine-rich RLK (RECEPTOR-like protein kinase) 8, partial [Striga hermonthica]